MKTLNEIQQRLKAPKGQENKFGGYKYRSCEDILEAVKPLLGDAIITLSDELVSIGNRYYVKATAMIFDDKHSVSVVAYAREAEVQKGMGDAQITGSASSYARKYALNGLLLIDDTKDDDTRDNTKPVAPAETAKPKVITPFMSAEATIRKTSNIGELALAEDKVRLSEKLTAEEKAELIKLIEEISSEM